MKFRLFALVFLIAISGSSVIGQLGVKYDFVVAKDGTGNFKTVQEAINAVPDFRKNETIIFIKKGIYKEKLILAESKSLITFIGESKDSTIITYDDYNRRKTPLEKKKEHPAPRDFIFMALVFQQKISLFKILPVQWARRLLCL